MSDRESQLEYIIIETLWMARRYANNRRTFAPSTVNECIDLALKLGLNIKTDTVDGIEMYAKDGDFGEWQPDQQRFKKEAVE